MARASNALPSASPAALDRKGSWRMCPSMSTARCGCGASSAASWFVTTSWSFWDGTESASQVWRVSVAECIPKVLALTADGWHMATHAGAPLASAIAASMPSTRRRGRRETTSSSASASRTPVDSERGMVSFQLGLGDEYHLPDVDHGSNIGGGNEMVISPTVVASPRPQVRIFGLVSLPVAQS